MVTNDGEPCDHDPGLTITHSWFRLWARCCFCNIQHFVGWRWDKRFRGKPQGPPLAVAREDLTTDWK